MSPWPDVEAARNRKLNRLGRVFGFFQCTESECRRWFPNERVIGADEPTKCPLHDEAAEALRARGKALKRSR